jgi:hypothetical protein
MSRPKPSISLTRTSGRSFELELMTAPTRGSHRTAQNRKSTGILFGSAGLFSLALIGIGPDSKRTTRLLFTQVPRETIRKALEGPAA